MGVRVVFPDMGKDPSIQLIEKTITENGTYDAITDGANGYSKVNVNVEGGGGGETWNTVFEGNVTTVLAEEGNRASGVIGYNEQITADVIKVTFNGTEYECNKMTMGSTNGYGEAGQGGPDFTNYPFFITSSSDGTINITTVYTQTAGTYSLKIEEPQSGGGESDFSTANVTFKNADINTNAYNINVSAIKDNGIEMDYSSVLLPVTVTVPLYKGVNILPFNCVTEDDESYMLTTEGSVELSIESGGFIVTGDGSITAKGTTKN